jgi:hypothetical protein
MNELYDWCDSHLAHHDIRAAVLPASGVIRVWVQMDRDGRRRVPLVDDAGEKLQGEAQISGHCPVQEAISAAADDLLVQLRVRERGEIRSIAGPHRFGRELRRFLHLPETFALLDPLQCGWLDGGCRILAVALRRWLSNDTIDLRRIGTDEQPCHHVMARCGVWYLDGDGVSDEHTLLHRWRTVEGVPGTRILPYDAAKLDAEFIPFVEGICTGLVERLARRFDAPRVLWLLMEDTNG